jgi:ABC-2 type transport system ATP-binding protein
MAVIDVHALTHRYGRHEALHDVSLSIGAGSVYALLGPNGSGKTTLLQAMMGLLPTTSGQIRVFDTPVQSLTAAHRARMGYVAEGQQLPSSMTLERLERYLAPLYPTWDAALATSLRERFQLDPSRKLRTLSRGEHMKAALLCALAPRPELLLMDEPFTGMDAAVKDDLVRGVLELSGREGWTVVIASHDLAELDLLCDWVGFLDKGRLQLSEPMDSVRARYRWVEIMTSDLEARLPNVRPAQWVWAEQAGPRVRVLVNEPDDNALQRAARTWYPSAARVEVHEASLRDVFVALTRSGQAASGGAISQQAGSHQEVA